MKRPKSITEYIASAPKLAQKKLREMRGAVRSGAPKAKEGIKWSMPAVSRGRILVMFAAHKNHIGFYPTPSALRAFAKELKKYSYARGSIQFPLDKPLPKSLVKKITVFRVRESNEQDKKWRP